MYAFFMCTGVDFTNLCVASKKLPAHSIRQKKFAVQFHQHSVPMKFAQYVWWNLPNEFAVRWMPFAKKKLLVLFSKKSRENILVKLTPGVHFINVLWAAFTCADPESPKKTVKLLVFFCSFEIFERKSCS